MSLVEGCLLFRSIDCRDVMQCSWCNALGGEHSGVDCQLESHLINAIVMLGPLSEFVSRDTPVFSQGWS